MKGRPPTEHLDRLHGEATFSNVVMKVLENRDFMCEYDRLNGTKFLRVVPRSPIERMVDEACGVPSEFGVSSEETRAFLRFVLDYIWAPLIAQQKGAAHAIE